MPESSSNLASITLLVNGRKIHTRISAKSFPSSAVPIVLLHGLGASGRYMEPTAELMSIEHPVFAPDLPGFGRSDKPTDALRIEEMADEVAAWLQVAGIKRAVFLGNSLGCQIIVDLAVRYPQVVQRAILVGPTIDRIGRTMWRQILRGCRDLWYEPWSLWRILAADYIVTGTRRMYWTLRFALQDPVEQKFPLMRTPTLLVRGSRDAIVPRRWIAEILAVLPEGRAVEISGGTHAANYSTPAELVRLVSDFLQKSPAAKWTSMYGDDGPCAISLLDNDMRDD